MNRIKESRREFLKRASVAALAFPLMLNCKSDTLAQKNNEDILSLIRKNANTLSEVNWCGAIDAPVDVSWKTALSKKSAKDEAIIISGTVFQSDGKTPAPNVLIYFYHTDSSGYYGRGNGEIRHGHFRGWLLTDKKGLYEFSTIKPAPYPNRNNPAHIHFTLTSINFKEDWINDIWFEGDELITPEIKKKQMQGKGGFNSIVKLEKGADGILRGVRDIQLWKI